MTSGSDIRAGRAYLAGPYPRAMAHRGWCLDDLVGMENSLSSFQRALDEGLHYLEIDVHATSDGVVVICHDPTLDRTTDATGPIVEQPWRRVRQARVAGREPVPPLDEVIERFPDALLNIDVKSDSAVAPVLQLLAETQSWDRVALASFSPARLTRIRALGGDQLLTSCSPKDALALRVRGWLNQMRVGPIGTLLPIPAELAQLPHKRGRLTIVDRSLVEAAHQLGIEVHVWTVNAPNHMRELLDLGVDGLITDRPDVLREVLAERDGRAR